MPAKSNTAIKSRAPRSTPQKRPMISARAVSKRLASSLALVCGVLCILATASNVDNASQDLYGQASESNNHNLPGHYEFEIAPRMEPPSVKKPPYYLSTSTCFGLDPFNAFSANDTLCGDLNKGSIPQNPLQQLFDGHPYPFELIKNKTLQFLARALPVLKMEYETIPKVARFVPANQLLNPTFGSLSSEHQHMLNSQNSLGYSPDFANMIAPSFVSSALSGDRRRRKKRHAMADSVSASQDLNATVLTSAHSAGRIQASLQPAAAHQVSRGEQVASQSVESTLVVKATRPAKLTRADPQPQLQPTPRAATASKPPLAAKTENVKRAAVSAETLDHDTTGRASKDTLSASSSSEASPQKTQRGSQQSEVATSSQPQSPRQTSLQQQQRRRSPCNDVNGGFNSIVCQATTALIDGDSPPSWLQLAKRLGSVYSSASDSGASTSATPFWSALASLLQEQPTSAAVNKSAGSVLTSADSPVARFLSAIWPLSSLFSSYQSAAASWPPSIDRRSDVASPTASTNSAKNNGQKKRTQPALGALVSIATPFAAGLASSALANLVEYALPTSLRSSSTTFARRKKPLDFLETFVDSPASMSAAASSGNARQSTGAMGLKQPPTPCQSVEEYISPTFARNYQGAWKYVVQIPHEGYFTQTIQRTSCVKQKCEFMDGVCHESPRWVSLLVAEIFYPNAVFSQSAADQTPFVSALAQPPMQMAQQQQMATAQTVNNMQQLAFVQQQHQQQPQHQLAQPKQQQHSHQRPARNPGAVGDPLQMTDSLQNYNYQLNSAFAQAATELGLDPTNVASMQQLANAYNYQLLQRNGISGSFGAGSSPLGYQTAASQPQPQIQRVSQAKPFSQQTPQSQIQQQQLQANNQMTTAANDYLTSLIAVAMQQNPQLSVNDVLSALQTTSKRRKKRDTSASQFISVPQHLVAQTHQFRRESAQSANDIGANFPPAKLETSYKGVQQSMPASQAPSQAQPASSPAPVTPDAGVNSNGGAQASGDQTECDGHDKIGCYVVRVYYDWFLVNGSCKCWRTANGNSNASNGLLRRIFVGRAS